MGATELVGLRQAILGAHRRLPVQVVRVGEIAFVAVGAELFRELGEQIRLARPGRYVLLATCASAYLSTW